MRAAILLLAGASLVLGTSAASEWSAGASAMRKSDAELARGKPRQAAVFARRAAEAAVPWSPHPARGYARLEAIAMAAEVEGRPDDAAFAWRAMRSAAMATRPVAAGRAKAVLAERGILRVARSPVLVSAPEAILRAELESTSREP
jgi:hypothetical protein